MFVVSAVPFRVKEKRHQQTLDIDLTLLVSEDP